MVMLQPPAWAGQKQFFSFRLAANLDSPHLPWVVFGYGEAEQFEFLKLKQLAGLKKSAQQIGREGFQNLQAFQRSWEQVEVEVNEFRKLRMLAVTDQKFAPEQILAPNFMQEAQRLLRAELLAVGIPRRELILATDADQPMDSLRRFATRVSLEYSSGKSEAITSLVFAVSNGNIVGLLRDIEEETEELEA
jgi:uncharacterized protein YtpQ (UPF0354 family)